MANYNPTIVVFVNIVFALITWGITAACKRPNWRNLYDKDINSKESRIYKKIYLSY